MAKAKTRIYIVTDNNGSHTLVRAYSPTQARSFVSERMFAVAVATQDTLVDLLSFGAKVEDAAAPGTADMLEGDRRKPSACTGPNLIDIITGNDPPAEDRSTHVTEVA